MLYIKKNEGNVIFVVF